MTVLPLTLVDAACVMPPVSDVTVRAPLLVMLCREIRPPAVKLTVPPVPVEIVVKAACVIGATPVGAVIVMLLFGPVKPVRTFLTAAPAVPIAVMLILPVVNVATSPVRLTPPTPPPTWARLMLPLDDVTPEKKPDPTIEAPAPVDVTFKTPEPVDNVPSVTVPEAVNVIVPVPLVDTLAFVRVIGANAFGAARIKLPFAPAETKELGLMVTPPAPSPEIVRAFGPVKPVLTELVTTEPGTEVIEIVPDEFVRTVPFSKTLPPTPVKLMLPLFVLMLVNAA